MKKAVFENKKANNEEYLEDQESVKNYHLKIYKRLQNIKINVLTVKMEGEQAAVQQPNFNALGNIIKSAMDGLGDKF